MIPPFDKNGVLPPYFGNVTDGDSQSPFRCDILEFCQRFGTSLPRRDILKGFVLFRLNCMSFGIRGFQWIDGSFVEDVESVEGRSPHDIDVASWFFVCDPLNNDRILQYFPEFTDPRLSKAKYMVDHYPLLPSNPLITIKQTRYWNTLFSHNRRGVWKGMLEIPLYDTVDRDQEALDYLNSL